MLASGTLSWPLIRTWPAALVLVAAAQALPWIVHLLHLPGPVLLPMPFAALLAGLALGPVAGLLNGLIAPLASFAVSGLPPGGLLPVLAVEMAAYGGAAGFLARRTAWRGPWVVLASLVAGRMALLAAVAVMGPSLGITGPAGAYVLRAAAAGWSGIALQVVVLSAVARVLAPAGRP
jgi:hypothetical protein